MSELRVRVLEPLLFVLVNAGLAGGITWTLITLLFATR